MHESRELRVVCVCRNSVSSQHLHVCTSKCGCTSKQNLKPLEVKFLQKECVCTSKQVRVSWSATWVQKLGGFEVRDSSNIRERRLTAAQERSPVSEPDMLYAAYRAQELGRRRLQKVQQVQQGQQGIFRPHALSC